MLWIFDGTGLIYKLLKLWDQNVKIRKQQFPFIHEQELCPS